MGILQLNFLRRKPWRHGEIIKKLIFCTKIVPVDRHNEQLLISKKWLFALKTILLICIVLRVLSFLHTSGCKDEISIHVSVTSQQEILPYFLSQVEAQEYPKKCIELKFFTEEHYPALIAWINEVANEYSSISLHSKAFTNPVSQPFAINGNVGPSLKQYKTIDLSSHHPVFFTDSNVVIVNPNTLEKMLATQYPLSVLVLNYTGTESMKHENKPSINCSEKGFINQEFECSPNAKISSFYLVRYDILNELTRDLSPSDVYSCGCGSWGYVLTQNSQDGLDSEGGVTGLRLRALNDGNIIRVKSSLSKFTPPPRIKTFMGLDHIYYVNLDRRSDRKMIMEEFSDVLGMQMERFPGVDGQAVTPEYLRELGATKFRTSTFELMVKKGYIGNMLTHTFLWASIVANKFERTLVLEDDVRIPPGAMKKFRTLQQELESTQKPWDFVYIYRAEYDPVAHEFITRQNTKVANTTMLVYPGFSYVVMAYLISLSGAKKLLKAKPLINLQHSDDFVAHVITRNPALSRYQVQYDLNEGFLAYAVEPNLFLQRIIREDNTLFQSDTEHSEYVDW